VSFRVDISLAAFEINAANLTLFKPGNLLAKYANDTHLGVPANNVDSRALKLSNIKK